MLYHFSAAEDALRTETLDVVRTWIPYVSPLLLTASTEWTSGACQMIVLFGPTLQLEIAQKAE